MFNFVLKCLYVLQGHLHFIRNFAKSNLDVPIFTKIKFFILGFLPAVYFLYDFSKFDKSLYLTDREKLTKKVLIDFNVHKLLIDKRVFSDLIESHVNVPYIYGYFTKGTISEHNGSGINSIGSLISKIKELSGFPVVIKPNRKSRGTGVFMLSFSKESGFIRNNEDITEEQLLSLLSTLDDFIAVEYLKQGEYSNRIFSETCNTIRFWMMIDPDTNKPFIARAFHRFGCNQSRPVDNGARGGIITALDLKTGKAQRSIVRSSRRYIDILQHPDSKADLSKLVIPNWDKVKKAVIELSERFNYIPYIGWDVVVSDDGSITIIEGNSNSDPYAAQLIEPLLIDSQIKRYYQYHKVIK